MSGVTVRQPGYAMNPGLKEGGRNEKCSLSAMPAAVDVPEPCAAVVQGSADAEGLVI